MIVYLVFRNDNSRPMSLQSARRVVYASTDQKKAHAEQVRLWKERNKIQDLGSRETFWFTVEPVETTT